jgi:hypothetical protein
MVFDEKEAAATLGTKLGHISLLGPYLRQLLKLLSQRHGRQDACGI